jgi:hypothetical protein
VLFMNIAHDVQAERAVVYAIKSSFFMALEINFIGDINLFFDEVLSLSRMKLE